MLIIKWKNLKSKMEKIEITKIKTQSNNLASYLWTQKHLFDIISLTEQ